VDIAVDAPTTLPPLPAAVEIAGYRIVLEALSNVLRHAGARRCTVRLGVEPDCALSVTVTDDGRGTPDDRVDGLGLAPMRERAAELGGRCTVGFGPASGTTVTAVLPFRESPVLRTGDGKV